MAMAIARGFGVKQMVFYRVVRGRYVTDRAKLCPSNRKMRASSYNLYLWIFLSLNFLQWIAIVEPEYGLPQAFKYMFSVFALGSMLWYRFRFPVKSAETITFEPLILFFVAWSLFLLGQAALGFDGLFSIQRVLGQRYFFLPYLLPLIVLYTRYEASFFARLLKVGVPLLALSVLVQFYVLAFNLGGGMYEALHRILLFDTGSALFLLTAHLSQNKWATWLTLAYFILAIVLYAQFGRRGLFLESLLLLLAMLVLRLRSPLSGVRDRMVLYFGIVVLGLLVMVSFEPVLSRAFIFQRGFDQGAIDASRGQVFADFFLDFGKPGDWLFGRGLDGHILRTIAEDESEQLIENGFLTVLLKGGLLYLIPMLLLMLRSAWLGLVRSRNDLARALALLVLVQIVGMVLFGLPDYATQYLWVWIAMAGCHSLALRRLSNQELYLIYQQQERL